MFRVLGRGLCLVAILALMACGGQGFAADAVREASPTSATAPTTGRGGANPTSPARGGATTPTPTGAAGQGTAPRASRATASRVRTVTPGTQDPAGAIPPGWQVYRGTAEAPFAIAYPPDWELDEAPARNGRVLFNSPTGAEIAIISSVGEPPPGVNPTLLRDRWFETWTDDLCSQTANEETGAVRASGLNFATVGGVCDANGATVYLLTGITLRDGVAWGFAFVSRYPRFQDNLRQYFGPMLNSLNIYDNP